MQAHYLPAFEREVGCTDADWRMWLPAALGEGAWSIEPASASAEVGEGRLSITWETMPPRTIALVRLPRLKVRFRFDNVDDASRHAFMRRFDLHMHRGGG